MRSSMPSQRAAVTEGLGASLTVMRLLAGVDSLVNSQGRSLDELLVALGVVADMRPDACVDSLMTGKVASSSETLATSAAGIGFNRSGGRLLLLWWLLRNMMHSHAGHAAHPRHISKAANLHCTMHRVLHLHGGLHGRW